MATDSITATVASNQLCTEMNTSYGLLVNDPSLFADRLQSKPNYFEFFPNPISEVLTIKGREPIESVVITNIFGQRVYNDNFDQPLKSMDVYVGHLPSGIYLVKVNNTPVEKVVKQ